MDLSRLQVFRKFLRKLERKVEINRKDESSCCGVTLAQCHVLLELDQMKNCSQKDLTQQLELDKSTLSRIIDKMLELDLLKREIRSEDKRYQELSLSPKGQDKANEINRLCNEFYQKVFEKIPRELHDSMIGSVEILVNAIEETTHECCAKGAENE